MDRGKIPGYYFDHDRQKYFKIQANHLLPQGAKYSQGHIRQEVRQSKKRKAIEKHEVRLRKQAVKRNAVLQHPIVGGIGLWRESGLHTNVTLSSQRDAAVLSQWQPKHMQIVSPGHKLGQDVHLTHAKFVPETQQLVTALKYDDTDITAVNINKRDKAPTDLYVVHGDDAAAAVHGSITSIGINMGQMLVTTNERPNVHMNTISATGRTAADVSMTHPGSTYTLHQKCEPIAARMNETTGIAAVAASRSILALDLSLNVLSMNQIEPDHNVPKLDWLDPNTLAYSSDLQRSSREHEHTIHLWDVRVSTSSRQPRFDHEEGVSTRFRSPKRVTGVLNPSPSNKSQLLVSTNHNIHTFDTRMLRGRSVLSIQHVHGGPEAQLATNGQDLLAAVDRDEAVQIYSVHSGTRITTLRTAQGSAWSFAKELQWYDDEDGRSTLQAVVNNGITRWAWAGSDDWASSNCQYRCEVTGGSCSWRHTGSHAQRLGESL